jgi:DNA-directed RNA polymerase subunit RPC12/RpoP
MNPPPVSTLANRLRRTIARRQVFARGSKRLALPTLVGAFYFGRWGEWYFYLGFVLFVVEASAIVVGENQRCPVCDSRLMTGRGWNEEFEPACPECGYVID